jgi:TetR/AcrR family transcriptional regulator, repressor of fatR-cypB operon
MGKREDILMATRDLIAEEGLQGFTFPKIFARAGVGSGTVYHYFPSKEDLISSLYRETSDLMEDEVLRDYDPSASFKERFISLMTNTIRFVLNRWKELAVLEACWHSPSLNQEVNQRLTPFAQTTISLLISGQELGIFLPLEAMLINSTTFGAIVGLVKGHLDGKYSLDEATIAQFIEAWWRALTIAEN